MRIIDLLSPAVICLCFATACNEAPPPSNANDIAQIKEISAARAKAFNEGHAQTIAEYFSEDALLMAPGKPVSKGKDAVQAYYETIFTEYNTVLESHYEEVEVSGNFAYGRGEAKVTITPKAGGPSSVSTAKYLNILKRTNGVWKTTHDIWNGNE